MTEMQELKDAMRIAVPVEPEDRIAARRARLVGVIEREIASAPDRMQKQRYRARLRKGLRALSAAAALLATLGLGMWVSESGHHHRAASSKAASQKLEQGRASAYESQSTPHRSLAGTTLETFDGHERRIALAGGTQLALSANTKVAIGRDTVERQDLELTSGGISLDVPEGHKSRRVRVRTKHATVDVKGTVFGVEVGRFDQPEGTPARTRVTVSRGRVLVSHDAGTIELNEGDSWVSPLVNGDAPSAGASAPQDATFTGADEGQNASPPASATVDEDASTTTAAPADERLAPDAVAGSARAAVSEVEPSTLAEQNGLLEQALTAEKRGNFARAERLVHRFLDRYPSSPLRSSALEIKRRLSQAKD